MTSGWWKIRRLQRIPSLSSSLRTCVSEWLFANIQIKRGNYELWNFSPGKIKSPIFSKVRLMKSLTFFFKQEFLFFYLTGEFLRVSHWPKGLTLWEFEYEVDRTSFVLTCSMFHLIFCRLWVISTFKMKCLIRGQKEQRFIEDGMKIKSLQSLSLFKSLILCQQSIQWFDLENLLING